MDIKNSSVKKNNYQIKIIKNIEEFNLFEKDWMCFENKYDKKEYNYRSIKYWISIFFKKNNDRLGYNKNLKILVLYKNNSIETILPLMKVTRSIKRYIKYTSLELIGSQFGFNKTNIIGIKNTNNIQLLIDWIKKNISFNILNISNLDYVDLSYLKNMKNYCYSASPIIQLDKFSDYINYQKSKYNSNMRKNLKRRKKMLYNDGGELLIKNYNEITEKEFHQIQLVSSSKELEGKHDHLKDESNLLFLKYMLEKNENKIVLAKLHNEVIGYQIIYLYQNFKIYSGLSYDRNYKKYGIGNLLENHDIENTIFSNNYYINMGPGLEDYKKYFATDYKKIFCVIINGKGLMSYFINIYISYKYKNIEFDFNRNMQNL